MSITRFALAASVLIAWNPARGADDWRVLEGDRLVQAFTNRQLGDGTHYAYRFRRDGTFGGFEMGRDVQGTWKANGSQICWTWVRPRGSEECYEVHRSGNQLRLFRKGYEVLSGTLAPLSSRK